MKKIITISFTLCLLLACSQKKDTPTFKEDLSILAPFDDITILKQEKSLIAISPSAHGQVFAISSNGYNDINRCYFNRDKINKHKSPFNIITLGGASRLMFGPQFGPYNVFFKPGTEQTDNDVRDTSDMYNANFKLDNSTDSSLTCSGDLAITNAQNYTFYIHVERHIELHSKQHIEQQLGLDDIGNTQHVAFTTNSTMANIGTEQWTRSNGLLALWDLSCMLPSDDNIAVMPLAGKEERYTNYFTPIDSKRLKIKDKVLYYKADAKYMNKIGLFPEHCTAIYGAYSPSLNQLVLNTYTFDRDGIYVNSENAVRPPYRGDVINIFNGEVNPSAGRNWPFYELESSSPAKELRPREEIKHRHSIYIFEGNKDKINKIAIKTLGVSLQEITSVF